MEHESFNEAALSSLTSKINQKLAQNEGRKQRKPEKTQTGRPKANRQEASQNGRPSAKDAHQGNKRPRLSRQTVDNTQLVQHTLNGTKSMRPHGEVKGKSATIASRPGPNRTSTDRDRLLQEILELDGDENDLNLIEDVESASEVEGEAVTDEKLAAEVRAIGNSLGLGLGGQRIPEGDEDDTDHSLHSSADNPENGIGGIKAFEGNGANAARPRGLHGLLFDPFAEWFAIEAPVASDVRTMELPHKTVQALHQRGKNLLQKENDLFAERNQSSSSSHQFYSTVIKSGTLTDKISALTLLVQESPLHNVRALETLVGLSKKRSRAQAIEVLTALKDLFSQGSILPSTRHLRLFAAQPGLRTVGPNAVESCQSSLPALKPLTDKHLLSWAYEDWLKARYFETLQVLETWSNDEIPYSRSKAVDMIFELLRDKPEQEANLLRLLVNKLGDSEKKIASRASYNLLQLQDPHPMMKENIASAIESNILFRPGQSLHAKYYAVITLNQTILSANEGSVVKKLLNAYFGVFRSVLAHQDAHPEEAETSTNKKGQIQGGGGRPGKMARRKKVTAAQKGASVEDAMREKIISAVLTGINRALPYTDTNDEFYEKHLDTLFRITHSSNFNTGIQAMLLMQQLCNTTHSAYDRFYRTLYESLLDPRLLQSSKQVLYLNLLYRALKSDSNPKRVQAFGKRLLQIVAMHQPPFVCAVVYLLHELQEVSPALATFIDQPEEQDNDEEEKQDHRSIADDALTNREGERNQRDAEMYDGRKRAPEFCHADRSCLWELDPLQHHFHPSASKFAHELMFHGAMPSKPTLESHTLIQFLDRFVYRNPKKHPNKWHGASIMQPLAASDSRSQLLHTRAAPDKYPVNAQAFSHLREDEVSVDDIFFHKYFKTLAQGGATSKAKKEKKKKEKKRASSEDSDEADEDEIWQALVDSKPDIEGSEDDMDMDMDDFSDMGDLDAAMDDLSDVSSIDDDDDDDDDDIGGASTSKKPSISTKKARSNEEDDLKSTSRSKTARKRKRDMKSLPTFASAEDYAAMVNNVEGEELEP